MNIEQRSRIRKHFSVLESKSTAITDIGVKWFYFHAHRTGSFQLRSTAGKLCMREARLIETQ